MGVKQSMKQKELWETIYEYQIHTYSMFHTHLSDNIFTINNSFIHIKNR